MSWLIIYVIVNNGKEDSMGIFNKKTIYDYQILEQYKINIEKTNRAYNDKLKKTIIFIMEHVSIASFLRRMKIIVFITIKHILMEKVDVFYVKKKKILRWLYI